MRRLRILALVEPVVVLWADEFEVWVHPSDDGWFASQVAAWSPAVIRDRGSSRWRLPLGELEPLCALLDRCGAVWALQWRAAPRTWAERLVAEVSPQLVPAVTAVLSAVFAGFASRAGKDAAVLEAAMRDVAAKGTGAVVGGDARDGSRDGAAGVSVGYVTAARTRWESVPARQVAARVLAWRECDGPPSLVVTVEHAASGDVVVTVHEQARSRQVSLPRPSLLPGRDPSTVELPPKFWWLWGSLAVT